MPNLFPSLAMLVGDKRLKLLALSLCCLMIFLLESSEAALSSGDQARGSLLRRGLWMGFMFVLEKACVIMLRVSRALTGPAWGDLLKLDSVVVGVLSSYFLEA